MKKLLLFSLFTLVACLLCSMSAAAAEAYACYTSSNTTLTFYYDNLRSSRSGTTYDLNTGNDYPSWHIDGTCFNVTKVVFDPSFANARPTTTYRWFYYMDNLQSFSGMKEYLNTSEVTDMSYMFAYCEALTNLDVSSFNTANVTDMCYMFGNCEALTSLDVSGFNTANVTDMSWMFSRCKDLEGLDLSSFNTAKVNNMSYMFNACNSLPSLDLSNFNTANVNNMNFMFIYCINLSTIYVGNSWSTTAVTSSYSMFFACNCLVGGAGTVYDANHVDKTYAHIDGGPSNPGYLSPKRNAYALYTSENQTLTFYYDDLRGSRPGTTYDIDYEYSIFNLPGWIMDWLDTETYTHPATQVVFNPSFADARPTSTSYWFVGMGNLQNISGINYLNTTEVTNMSHMFGHCSSLTSLDLSSFNTANVIYMEGMFSNCSGLMNLDLSSFNTSNVGDMSSMFEGCTGLTSLDLSSFNTAQAAFIPYMFYGCSNLTTIYVGSEWDLPANANSDYMFDGCTSLVGGKGTTYDANHIDAAYAHIDGGSGDPGYFTAKAGGQHGDVNGDGIVNISDATALINLLLSASALPSTADFNQDGIVNISDATALINFLLGGNWN